MPVCCSASGHLSSSPPTAPEPWPIGSPGRAASVRSTSFMESTWTSSPPDRRSLVPANALAAVRFGRQDRQLLATFGQSVQARFKVFQGDLRRAFDTRHLLHDGSRADHCRQRVIVLFDGDNGQPLLTLATQRDNVVGERSYGWHTTEYTDVANPRRSR